MNRSRRNPLGCAVLLLGFAGFVAGVVLLVAFHASPPLAGTEAICQIAKAAKSGECMQYVVQIRKAVVGNSSIRSSRDGVINGDGREVRSGIMVIPIDMQQLSSVAWDSSDPHRGEGGGNMTCYVYTKQVCPMQKGFLPHQLNEGCCPRNDANEGGAQGTWIYAKEQDVRSEKWWFPILGTGLVVLGLLLMVVGYLLFIRFGFACVMQFLDEKSNGGKDGTDAIAKSRYSAERSHRKHRHRRGNGGV